MFFAFLQQTSFKVKTSITSQQNNHFLNLWSSFANVWLYFHAIETIIISLQVTLYLPNQVDFSMLKKKKSLQRAQETVLFRTLAALIQQECLSIFYTLQRALSFSIATKTTEQLFKSSAQLRNAIDSWPDGI